MHVWITISTYEGEILERFKIEPMEKDQGELFSEVRLASRAREVLEQRFESKED